MPRIVSGASSCFGGVCCRWAKASGSGLWPSVIDKVCLAPSLTTIASTVLPTAVFPTSLTSSPELPTSWPSKDIIISILFKPASKAGPSKTSRTIAPDVSAKPRASAMSSVTLPMLTPSQPRRTSPNSRS